LGLAPSSGYLGKHVGIVSGDDFFFFLLTSLGGLLYMSLDDLSAMGWKLSFQTVVVVWQSLWCSKSVAKGLLEWGIQHCLYLHWC
jgi:hypothetical protein